MLVMRATEHPAHPLGELVRSQEAVGLDDLALGVDPLGLDGVQPRALLRQKAAHDPHPLSALLDAAVVGTEPAPDLAAYVPGSVVPDEQQDLLAGRSELFATPREEPGGQGAHGPSVHEPQPRLSDLRQVEPVAAYGFGLGVVLGDRPLEEAQRLPFLGPAVQGGKRHPAPPALVLEAHRPLRIGPGDLHQPVAPPFFLSYRGSGEVIHRLARVHLTERRRDKVARMVSPETRSSVSPSSKATSAAISRVHRLEGRPNSLGEWWSISRRASALFGSKASRVLLGREDFASRARRPLSLKSFMASRTVCEAHPRFSAILGARSPRELTKMICDRRMVKVCLERRPALRRSRSSSDNERTKMGFFMEHTVTRQPKPILKMH